MKMLMKKGSKEPLSAEAIDSLLHEISILRYARRLVAFVFVTHNAFRFSFTYSKLRNPNILLFLGACLEFPNICFLTELMPFNLHDLITKGKIYRSKKISMAIEITKALKFLHSNSPPLLHRDLKVCGYEKIWFKFQSSYVLHLQSMNVLVDENYHIKLADFGAVSLVKAIETGSDKEKGGDTQNPTTSQAVTELQVRYYYWHLSFHILIYFIQIETIRHHIVLFGARSLVRSQGVRS